MEVEQKELVLWAREDRDLGKPMGEYESTRKPGHCSFLPECDNRLQKDHWCLPAIGPGARAQSE